MTHMIYLDNNATTQPAPEVVEAMLPFYREQWGNPSSLHLFGRQLTGPLHTAREQAAAAIGARRTAEIVFTSGGSEGNNTAIRGVLAARPDKRHIVTTAVEHSAVLHCCRALEKEGYRVTYLPVGRHGGFDFAAFEAALTDATALATVMWANNETGTIFPIARIAALCRARGIPIHTDAVQALGKVPIDVETVPVDLLSVSGHKLHAAKGIGFLYIRRGTPFRPLIIGGGQEHGRRAGTENVAQIVGLGTACALAVHSLQGSTPDQRLSRPRCRELCERPKMAAVGALRDRLEQGLRQRITGVHVNGDPAARVPNTTNISIEEVDGEALILSCSEEGLCCSTGSACASGSAEPSHVLLAMHLPPPLLRGILRLSLSRYTTEAEVDRAVEIIAPVVERLRRLHPRN